MKDVGKAIRISVGAAALLVSHSALASTTVYPTIDCTKAKFPSNPPPVVETSLGSDVDNLAYVSNQLQVDLKGLKDKGWQFSYDSSGYADRIGMHIHVQKSASYLANTSGLSHEVGHAKFLPRWDFSSKDAYLKIACADEGNAVYKNIIVRRVILGCPAEAGGGKNIGLAAALPWDQYIDMVDNASLPFSQMNELGMMFCENNVTSTTGETYLEYYGKWYDDNYPNGGSASALNVSTTSAPTAQNVDNAFWNKIEGLSKAASKDKETLVSAWPSSDLREDHPIEGNIGKSLSSIFRGGKYDISNGIVVTESTIKTRSDGSIGRASFKVEGACITRQEIEQRYPDLVLTDVPMKRGLPYSVSTFRSWGQIGFIFNDKEQCLAGVFFDPHPEPFSDPLSGSEN